MKDFEKLYREYYPTVYGFIINQCKDEHVAEEITQETFFKVLKNIDKYRGDCKFSVWVCQIAKNTYYSFLKKNNRLTEYKDIDGRDETNIEQSLVDKETSIKIHEILHKIKEPYKEVFWMRAFGELSFEEIAKVHNKTSSWARVTYHRAKIMIQEELQ